MRKLAIFVVACGVLALAGCAANPDYEYDGGYGSPYHDYGP